MVQITYVGTLYNSDFRLWTAGHFYGHVQTLRAVPSGDPVAYLAVASSPHTSRKTEAERATPDEAIESSIAVLTLAVPNLAAIQP